MSKSENERMNGIYVKALPEWWQTVCPKCGHAKLHDQECEWCLGKRTHEHQWELIYSDENSLHFKCSVCSIERTVTKER